MKANLKYAFIICSFGLTLSTYPTFGNNLSSYSFSEISSDLSAPKDRLIVILKKLEKDFDIHFLYQTDIVESIYVDHVIWQSNEKINDILEPLLEGTGVKYKKISENSYIIIPSREEINLSGVVHNEKGGTLIGATVYSKSQNKGVITDLNGSYNLALKPGNHDLEIRFVGYKSENTSVKVNPIIDGKADFVLEENTTLDEIVVLGSKFKPLEVIGSARPLQRVNGAEISKSGFNSLSEILHGKVPSFYSTFQTISDGTDHISPSSLRGLGPDQLLVLVNGKRRHHTSLLNINGTVGRGTVATDINAIPLSAIEDIEILSDEAVALYGSDAIAGVINIKLKRDINYSEVKVLTGVTQKGDGQNIQLSGIFGSKLGEKGGFLNLSMDFKRSTGIDRSGDYTGLIFGDSRDTDPVARADFYSQTGLPYGKVMQVGAGGNNNVGFFLNFELPLDQNFELYGFSGINYRLGDSRGFYRFPFQRQRQSGLYEFGFSPILNTRISDQSATLGIRRQNSDWKVDLSNTFGRNSVSFAVKNSNNASLGLASPVEGNVGGFGYFQNVMNLDAFRAIGEKKNVDVGFGFEFKLEGFSQHSGDESTFVNGGELTEAGMPREIGMQMFPGFGPNLELAEDRISLGSYVALESSLSDHFSSDLAARAEYYVDYGASLIWQAGLKYSPSEKFALRASANTGFRAPSMPQVHHQSESFQFVSQNGEIASARVSHIKDGGRIARRINLDHIKPETSSSKGLGIAFTPSSSFSIEADAYQISIKDRIVLSGIIPTKSSIELQEIFATEDISSIQFLSNAIGTKTHGLSFSSHYSRSVAPDMTLTLRLNGNVGVTELIKNSENKPEIKTSELFNNLDGLVFNREEVARIEKGIPNQKYIASFSISKAKWSAQLSATHYGAVSYLNPRDGDQSNWILNEYSGLVESRDQTFTKKTLFDFNFDYKISNVSNATLGVNNLFDTYPDRHTHSGNVSNGIFTYSRRVSQFGVRGRYIFASLALKF